MNRLLYYSSKNIIVPANFAFKGIEKFSVFFNILQAQPCPVDRTGTIRFPIRTKSLYPIPTFKTSTKTYGDICNDRAVEILRHAQSMGIPLYVFWSGGIDSTLVLVSLLKNGTKEQISNIVVLLTEESIRENERFYDEHIHRHLRCESSVLFPYLLGGRSVIINGEHNDQLFGAEWINGFMSRFGSASIHERYDADKFRTSLGERIGDSDAAALYVELFERLKNAAPIDIHANLDLIWWINFAINWQVHVFRTIAYTAPRNISKITAEYIDQNYMSFYGTDDFQLWSMNNLDKRIRNDWRSYKWPAKDLIYDYTRDTEYRDNKIKRGSFFPLLDQLKPYGFIDESYYCSYDLDAREYYEPENDFL